MPSQGSGIHGHSSTALDIFNFMMLRSTASILCQDTVVEVSPSRQGSKLNSLASAAIFGEPEGWRLTRGTNPHYLGRGRSALVEEAFHRSDTQHFARRWYAVGVGFQHAIGYDGNMRRKHES